MAIICCSKDDILLGKIVALYGADGVIPLSDLRLLDVKDSQPGGVLIVDFKSSKIPAKEPFSLPILALSGNSDLPRVGCIASSWGQGVW